MLIRAAIEADFEDAVSLYEEFGAKLPVLEGEAGRKRWCEILNHPGTTVFLAEMEGRAVSVATLHVMPNLTLTGRPYALVENVITAAAFRGRGLARRVMRAAIDHAWACDAYKIMLLTGQQRADGGAVGFYEKLGFSTGDKHAMTMRRVPSRD